MTSVYQPRIGDALHALWRANLQDALTGSYVESGLNASPGSSGSSIQVDVDPGDGRINDSPVSPAGDTLTLDAVGTSGEYRADVIYMTTSGGLAVEKGYSAPPEPTISDDPYPTGTPQPARRLFSPSPPDGSSIAGLPIHVVLVADTTSDSTDLALEDIVDYRVAPPLPGDHSHPEFALNQRAEYLLNTTGGGMYTKLATINDGTGISYGSVRVQGWRANQRSQEVPRAIDVQVDTGVSDYGVEAYAKGSRSGATDIIVTEEPASEAGTAENRYHLYAFLPSGAGTMATMVHGEGQFGGWDFEKGLAQNDLIGSVVWDTGNSTGGPGGELQVPKASAAVRSDIEGETDVSDLVSGEASSPNQVPVSRADGSVIWTGRLYRPGEWESLGTWTFPHGGQGYSTSSDSFTGVTAGEEGVVISNNQLNNRRFDTLGVSLAAGLTTDSNGDTASARIAYNLLGGDNVPNTAISTDTTDITPKSSSRQTVDFGTDATSRLFLEMKTQGGNVGTAYMPTINLWGQVK